jgi:dihydroorotate dehydrogenase (NAD+) catalytic subunit
MSSRISIEIAGLKLENPTMLSSGILGLTGSSLKRVADAGAGAVTTKSVGLEPREGFPNPTVVQVESGLLNAIGLPNPGIHYFVRELGEFRDRIHVPIILSIFGFSSEEYAELARIADRSCVDAIEVNVSCPHVKRTGGEIGQNPQLVAEVVGAVRKEVDKPVFVKLTPNTSDVVETAKAAVDSGADAVTVINTIRAMAIDLETARPILSNKFGGLSGPAIKPVALRCTYEVFQGVEVPVIGCGGISTWQDAVEFMLAGASAVQIGTAIAFKGLQVFKSITKGIGAYLEKKGFGSVNEVVGRSHSH